MQLVIFFLCVLEFHLSEYFLARKFQPECTMRSFLLSGPYVVAMSVGLAEYVLLRARQPSLAWSITGISMIIMGEIVRKTAICTAKENFSHKLALERSKHHHLVTQGIYHYIRHPSYLGFCLYALGTQIWLGNYVCTFLFMIILWKFMSQRIAVEDALLYQFFGNSWVSYCKSTWSGIPYVP